MPKLSVVIPSYNEAERIAPTITYTHEFLKKQGYDFEILVVVDGAKDAAAQVVAELQTSVPELRLINNPQNHGKGYVVRQGMLEAKGEIRLFMDADNSTKVDHIAEFMPFFDQGFDIVAGSRRIAGADIAVHQGFVRDFLGGVFRFIVHTIVPLGVTDSQCGFKAFTAEAAERVFPKQVINRWAFDVEVLAIARKYGLKIKEAPIRWVNDGASTVRFSGMVHMLLEVLEVRWGLWTGKYR
ncbi:MAG: glycosyltransferase family 2 protein [Candidatus Doudnabacteria bacterium]|nr:glycosyltransferase family 2 protein [Candidatus Doudnabacteria bacterium]